MSSPPLINVNRNSLTGSTVISASNQCSVLPFLPFSIGLSETKKKDPGQTRDTGSFLFSHSSVKFLSHQTQSMSISISEIDPKHHVVE